MELKNTAPVRGRFAPTPTGSLHLGNAMTFLAAWLSVRSRGGRIVMRIEDLGDRRYETFIDGVCRDLERLGLDWDEGYGAGGSDGPYRQSERFDLYRSAIEQLRRRNLVYPCVCSRRTAREGVLAPHEGEYCRYDGRCRDRFSSYAEAQAFLGKQSRFPAWRFRAPDREVVFTDEIAGVVRCNVFRRNGDFAIARHPDGAGYQLAVVVDDIAMGITEVVRGADLLECTPWQLLLYEALAPETPHPRYRHAPLVLDNTGNRMAKRIGSLTLDALFADKVPPERIVGLLGYWGGWLPFGESLTARELLRHYRPDTPPPPRPTLDDRALALLR